MMNRIIFLSTLATGIFLNIQAQNPNKLTMDHDVYDIWRSIDGVTISNNGDWTSFTYEPGNGDKTLIIRNLRSGNELAFDRAGDLTFTEDSRYAIFQISPAQATLKELRREGVKNDKLPPDTLAILSLESEDPEKIPYIEEYSVPEKWSGTIAYVLKEGKKSRLVIHHLMSGSRTEIPGSEDFVIARDAAMIVYTNSGEDSTVSAGVYLYNCETQSSQPIYSEKGKYSDLAVSRDGSQVAFLADTDTVKKQYETWSLYHWEGTATASQLVSPGNDWLPQGYFVSEHRTPQFSKDGRKLFFGIQAPPILQDTNLLDEEIVNVEVWNYKDPVLYTMQESRLNNEKRRNFLSVWNRETNQFIQVANEEMPDADFSREGDGDYAMAENDIPYSHLISWEGYTLRDLYLVDLTSGEKLMIAEALRGNPRFSPEGKYIYWYNNSDTAWYTYDISQDEIIQITSNDIGVFYDELNDRPMDPGSEGMAGWTAGDQAMWIYDRYDIWSFNPALPGLGKRLTNGRRDEITYRYIRLDREEQAIPSEGPHLLHHFDHKDKSSGYSRLQQNGTVMHVIQGDYLFDRSVIKARDTDDILYTRQTFEVFPDYRHSTLDFTSSTKVTNANPQQASYSWGTSELTQWTSLDGETLQGILYKPERFLRDKKYPTMVYFYERNSHNLHRYRPPAAPRSSIPISFYVNRGYLVFVPDIPYRIGYPGESCYNAVVPGVTALVNRGLADPDRIGVQGHSWGGYQIAYLLTRTNIFRCAEAGAPVVNMFSAYGGIRWGSGMSRAFQYERTQSRIGGSIWEYPLRYTENSPLFTTDKIETPVLILHNDDDTAVPWYQGIEFFTALRRLGKPAWLLNYNGEPHGITKYQNKVDFARRMQQFFDHYLMGAPMPQWMEEGVPAIEKGINAGFQVIKP